MDFGVSEFLHESFKSGVSSLSYSSWAPPDVSPAGFQSQLLWVLSFPVQAPQAGDPTKGLRIPRESDLEGQWDLIIISQD